MTAASALANRIHDIIRRMADNIQQPEATKTCYGILAIMSREEASKVIIARDGMEVILSGMQTHIEKSDVQEAGCDLIWSLAFNNTPVKEIVGKYGGTSVVVRALKRHHNSAEFLKSACGSLSNLCQHKVNQIGVASHGGMQPLISSITIHQDNAKILPFIFDAIASLIVGNEENAKMMSGQDGINRIIAAITTHKDTPEVVKSGCHALAILSDVKGQALKISSASGVAAILPLLDIHPSYADFHRVAAVVLLRMLQESSHIVSEIAANEGVRILLKSLDKGGAQQDTVAAITHILATVTNPLNANTTVIEPQLWIAGGNLSTVVVEAPRRGRFPRNDTKYVVSNELVGSGHPALAPTQPAKPSSILRKTSASMAEVTALGGLVRLLGQYAERRDVARASCRLLNNLIGFPGVVIALDKLYLMDKVLECVHNHGSTRDIVESSASLLRVIHKRTQPTFLGNKLSSVKGLFHLMRCKHNDEEVLVAATDMLIKLLSPENKSVSSDAKRPNAAHSMLNQWSMEAILIVTYLLENMVVASKPTDAGSPKIGSMTILWTKHTPRLLNAILELLEVFVSQRVVDEHRIPRQTIQALNGVDSHIPSRHGDIQRRLRDFIARINPPMIDLQTFLATPSHASEHANDRRVMPAIVKRAESPTKEDRNNITGRATTAGAPRQSSPLEPEIRQCVSDEPDKPSEWTLPSRTGAKTASNSKSKLDTARLIDTMPNFTESLLNDSGRYGESTTVPARMHVVYENQAPGGREIVSRCPTPSPYVTPPNGLGEPFQHSIKFDAEFESGNLLRAVQRAENEYDLFLRADINTPGHTQWFYFSVSNTHPPAIVELAEDHGLHVPTVKIKFNIVNFTKPDSLFNMGMRPVVYSYHNATTKGIGWVRAGHNISYYSNNYERNNSAGEGNSCYYSLTFTMEFGNPNDTYLIAYCYPYTYSDYKAHLQRILERQGANDIIRQSKLCLTMGGNECDLLVITNFKDKENLGPILPMNGGNLAPGDASRRRGKPSKTLRKAIFLSCRVHPGETPASWMMQGALEFLTSDAPEAKLLRQTFVIFVIPMLNPDGVIYGNNRCGLAGVDLNRQWKQPVRSLHPTIYHLKSLIQEQKMIRDVSIYIDLHGHSRKYNVFMYGCDDKKRPNPKSRAFPKFLSAHDTAKKYFSYDDCSFHVRKGRESTARVVVTKELNVAFSYTLEATFCGADYGPLKHCHMNTTHLREMGSSLCDSLLHFFIGEGAVVDQLQLAPSISAKEEEEGNDINDNMSSANSDGAGSLARESEPDSDDCDSDGEESTANNNNNTAESTKSPVVSSHKTAGIAMQAQRNSSCVPAVLQSAQDDIFTSSGVRMVGGVAASGSAPSSITPSSRSRVPVNYRQIVQSGMAAASLSIKPKKVSRKGVPRGRRKHRVSDMEDDDDSGIFSASGKSDGIMLPASTTLIFTNSKSEFAQSKTSVVMGKKFHHEERNKSMSISSQQNGNEESSISSYGFPKVLK